jgi:predicted MPP superfamily phosphohydrolase
VLAGLKNRMGKANLNRRLQLEANLEAKRARETLLGHAFSKRSVTAAALKLSGLAQRGLRNALNIQIKTNDIKLSKLPDRFEGLTILHISDLHADVSEGAVRRLIQLLPQLRYHMCVAMEAFAEVSSCLVGPVYAVLGNHDCLAMIPALEQMGVRLLLNEADAIERAGQQIYVAGIDDAHYYGTHDIARAAAAIPGGAFSILLSHTPEVYRDASFFGFDLLFSGHTHGGQICLPGSIPVTLSADLPRHMGSGSWKYRDMTGYTSVGVGTAIVAARFNCPPEITLHCLRCR